MHAKMDGHHQRNQSDPGDGDRRTPSPLPHAGFHRRQGGRVSSVPEGLIHGLKIRAHEPGHLIAPDRAGTQLHRVDVHRATSQQRRSARSDELFPLGGRKRLFEHQHQGPVEFEDVQMSRLGDEVVQAVSFRHDLRERQLIRDLVHEDHRGPEREPPPQAGGYQRGVTTFDFASELGKLNLERLKPGIGDQVMRHPPEVLMACHPA